MYKKFFTLSFDDGLEMDKRIIERMRHYGLSGTFNINAGLFGYSPRFVKINRLPKNEIRDVYEGFEVASHGYKHEMFRYMTRKKIEESLSRDIDELSELMGYQIAGHAYPYDMHTKYAENYLRSRGILYSRRALGKGSFRFPEDPLKYNATCWFNSKKIFTLIDEFVNAKPENGNMLFMMWGHSYELEYGYPKCTPERLEQIFSRIAGHSDIVYCTSKEAFEGNKG